METSIGVIAQLGGTVFTVVAFLYFLTKNQDIEIASRIRLADALENLTEKIILSTSATKENTNAK